MSPPSSVATSRAIDSPSPVPPYRRLSVPSPCWKAPKIACRFSGAMPMPVSVTENATPSGRRSGAACRSRPTRSTTRPLAVNLTALDSRLPQHLAQPLPVGEHLGRRVGVDVDRERQALLRGHRLERGLDVLQQRAQREALRVDVHPARLDLGQVEDVVDELQQVRAGRMDDVGVLDLLGGEVAGPGSARAAGPGSAGCSAACAARATCWPGTGTCTSRPARAAGRAPRSPAGPARSRRSWSRCRCSAGRAVPPSPPVRRWSAAARPAGPAIPPNGPAARRSAAGTRPAARRCASWPRSC